MIESHNTNVFINKHEFHAVRLLQLSLTITPLSHPADEQYNVVDHIRQEPARFKMTLRVFDRWNERGTSILETRDEKLELLKGWYKDRGLNLLETDLGTYEYALITKLKIAEIPRSDSSYDVEMEMEEALIAYLTPIEEQYYIDADGNEYGQTAQEGSSVDGTLSDPNRGGPKDEGWSFGHNIYEINKWLLKMGDNDIYWKWPWE